MSEAVSIGEIEAILAKMTPGKYEIEHDRNDQANIYAGENKEWIALLPHQCVKSIEDQQEANAAGLVAEHNAFPVLAAAVKAALRYIALNDAPGEMNEAHLAKMFAAKDELRAALRKVRL